MIAIADFSVLRDLAPALANHRLFVRLRDDDALFRTIRVNEDGNGVEWDDGSELSAEWIERLTPTFMANADFRAAMDELHMSLEGMAATLGTSRRLIADYRKDKPIPSHIGLAVRYLLQNNAAQRLIEFGGTDPAATAGRRRRLPATRQI